MRKLIIYCICLVIVFTTFMTLDLFPSEMMYNNGIKHKKNFHDFTVETIDGKKYDLAKLRGKRVLVVNTASKCGLTSQYKVLQQLYQSLDTSKYQVIAFPANNFLQQEPGSNRDIAKFCSLNYGVSFPIMAKVSVCDQLYHSYPPQKEKSTATSTAPIYQWLTQKDMNGVLDTKIQWNFQKFLIDENGELVGTLPPSVGAELLLLKKWLK